MNIYEYIWQLSVKSYIYILAINIYNVLLRDGKTFPMLSDVENCVYQTYCQTQDEKLPKVISIPMPYLHQGKFRCEQRFNTIWYDSHLQIGYETNKSR